MKHFSTYLDLFIGRLNDFAQQNEQGGYWRVGRPVTMTDATDHLSGQRTLGSYVIDEAGQCHYAVFDADSENGLAMLHQVQARLARHALPSYLERSRRGGHLWVFFAAPRLASHVRAWLLPMCPAGVEFYLKQAESSGYGSLIRLPLGIHRRSGKRYPFVEWTASGLVSVASTVPATLDWFTTVQRAEVPALDLLPQHNARTPRPQETSFSNARHTTLSTFPSTIRAWCAEQDPSRVIGTCVDLNSQGIGSCPFGWHHAHGHDTHASFKVYSPGRAGGYSWYCYTWQQGGSVFDFLRYWSNLDAREMWRRLQAREVQI